ncbi:MAG: Signal peptidase-like protein [Gemmatimonadales bacterium]|nr:Signal peptidase-like protein [Gemmatimonadales bacterium]NIN13124.1 Signal peptidase-like protein [Gemmatimonadales bacterium]NIN51208.1 Signal peptidase-like protein [Gemmatimonadales bacterium]NIP08672.1 Signal peptidase-like protein [Gemmatimonadales bacterium]NIR02360.1 Signal peptidase-like protein [Gemmatimonadales bacterium]
MSELVEVRFKGNRRACFTWEEASSLALGDPVVVAVERGEDLGRVSAVGAIAERKCGVGCNGCSLGELPEATGKVLRNASVEDAHLSNELRRAEEDVRRKVMERVQAHGLLMKVSDAEWQWDRKKLTVYFTADKRVDFRALVRDLAGLFRTRIELRQIGARDESKRLDGVGRCGRQYCCSSWLPELRPVSLSLAKDQQLSLNPSQISGGCGRLLCCLRYEHDFYVSSRKRFPKVGRRLRTERGTEKVEAVDIFRDRVLLKGEDETTRTVMLFDLKQEVAAETAGTAATEKRPAEPASESAEAALTTQEVVEAVSPRKRRRRRRRKRGRRGSRRRSRSEDRPDSPKDERDD